MSKLHVHKMDSHTRQIIESVPQQSQRMDSLYEQLLDLREFARRLGMYDADDFIKQAGNMAKVWENYHA